jgi:hypothetical protein
MPMDPLTQLPVLSREINLFMTAWTDLAISKGQKPPPPITILAPAELRMKLNPPVC